MTFSLPHPTLARMFRTALIALTAVVASPAASQRAAMAQSPDETVRVALETTQGTITLELDKVRAPGTVENFVKYVNSGHYDGTVFHRVIQNFMIQGGGHTADMSEKEVGPPIRNEASNGLKNDKYTIAMARKNDPHSATAQFFINTSDQNGFLNRDQAADGFGYTVFGKVVDGIDVVDKIAALPTRKMAVKGMPVLMSDVPEQLPVITAARVLSE